MKIGNNKGFFIQYEALKPSSYCGGNYTHANGILSSPSFPNSYPQLANCIYLIAQPNGAYVNISFITMDINCPDYIDMRDGKYEDSPLMGRFCGNGSNVPVFMQTTQNHIWMRWWGTKCCDKNVTLQLFSSFLTFRFFSNSFESGMGFQLRYEFTNVSDNTFRIGTCGGSFTTPNGVFSSPSYPGNYPDGANCIYTISQPSGTVIQLKSLDMDISQGCRQGYGYAHWICCDYLEIRDGPYGYSRLIDKRCGNRTITSIQSTRNNLWMRWPNRKTI